MYEKILTNHRNTKDYSDVVFLPHRNDGFCARCKTLDLFLKLWDYTYSYRIKYYYPLLYISFSCEVFDKCIRQKII